MTRRTILCPDFSDHSLAVSSPVDLFESISIPTFSELQRELFGALWDEIHTRENPDAEWFATWRARVPSFSDCGCSVFLDDYCVINPPRFDNFPRWSWELHNAVNAKLGRALFPWWSYVARYRPRQSPITGLVAVTSLSPNRFQRQTICLDSWRKLGLEIIAVNSQDEIDSMRKLYPVAKWIPTECQGHPRINSLIEVAASENTAILIINADIEIYGDQSRLLESVASRKNLIGIRHNYDSQPGESTIEPWGLDAFTVYPEQVASIPRVEFTIGKPMWDYWLPWEFEKLGECDWITEPYFFHRSHPVAWSQAECTSAHEAFAKQFGPMNWIEWRMSRPPY